MNALSIVAHSKVVLRPFVYSGPDMRAGVASLLGTYIPGLSVRYDGGEIPGEFSVPDGITVFEACEDLYEVLGVLVEWWSDCVVIRERPSADNGRVFGKFS